MNALRYLEGKEDIFNFDLHPMFGLNPEEKYVYCFGVGVMALGSMKALTELQVTFEVFLNKIGIEPEVEADIMSDINNHFSERIREVFQLLLEKRIQYCFFVDLYKIFEKALWSQEYAKSILKNFYEATHTYPEVIAFYESFYKAYHSNNMDLALKAYQQLQEHGLDIDYDILKYFYDGFQLEDHYDGVHVPSGKTVVWQHKVYVDGDIVLEKGSSLLLQGAEVIVNGRLYANGSRIWLRDAKLDVLSCPEQVFMTLSHVAVVHMESSTIDCHGCCGFLKQDSGRMILRDMEIRNTSHYVGVDFDGQSAKVDNTLFQNMTCGGIRLGKEVKAVIEHSEFLHCESDYGGGIFSESIEEISVESCDFKYCRAKYLGAAVYFKYEKFGQIVMDCTLKKCLPEEGAVFNSYMDDLGFAAIRRKEEGTYDT